jgi:hypothetical protein
MHHYRCQNVYISTTASDRIVDTLELFPHNYQLPQLSSTDRLLMAAKDMTDALQNTIAALTDLAAIFKLKLQQALSPHNSRFASQSRFTPQPRSPTQPNLELANAHQAANEITDDNSHSRHPQCAISSEGGHT